MKKIATILLSFLIPLLSIGQVINLSPDSTLYDLKILGPSAEIPSIPLDSLSLFIVSAQDLDTAIITAVGFDSDATNHQLRYLEGLTYPTITTGTQALSSADSTAFQGLKVKIDVPSDNTNYAFRLFSTGVDTVFNSDTVQLDAISISTLVYYVDEDRADNSGDALTPGAAWKDLDYAILNALVIANRITIIAPDPRDTWELTSTLNIDISGTADDARVFLDGRRSEWSQPNDTATIKNTGGQHEMLEITTARYVTIQNIIFDANDQGGMPIELNPVLSTDYCEYITIKHNEMKNSNWGVFLSPDSVNNNNIIIDSNYIHHTDWHGIAIYKATAFDGSGTNNIIDVRGNIMDSIHLGAATTGYAIIVRNESNNVTLSGNIISKIAYTNGDGAGIGIEQASSGGGRFSTNLKIIGNHIDIDSLPGIILDQGDAVTALIANNVVKTTDGDGLVISNGDNWTGATIRFYNNTSVSTDDGYAGWFGTYANLNLDLQNNAFFSNDGQANLRTGTISNFTHNNNGYYKEGTSQSSNWVTSAGSNYTSGAAVQSSFEATAQVTDPLFNTEFTDLRPRESSPLLLNGTDLTATVPTDIIDSTYFTPMTIGAYADSVVSAYSAEAQALFDELIWTPGSDTLDAIALAIDSLVDYGYWAIMPSLHWEGMENHTDAKLNWINPSAGTYDLVETGAGSLTHTKYQGTQGDGTNYYTFGFNPATFGVSLNDFTIGVYLRLNIEESMYQMGADDGSDDVSLAARWGGNDVFARMFGGIMGVGSTDSKGLWFVTRTASNEIATYKDGALEVSDTDASSSIADGDLTILANSGSNQSSNEVLCDFTIDAGVALADVVIINRIIERLADFIGAGVQ